MPLISKIELSNFMNHRREDPWRPDWPHQIFNLECENTAINITNGRGKSTLMHAILAMLVWAGRDLKTIRLTHFAPAKTGNFTHIRIEIRAELPASARGGDLVTQSGGEIGGAPVVIGMYGNSDDNSRIRLYAYQGELKDCPIARISGLRHELVADAVFMDKADRLREEKKFFPGNSKEESQECWRGYISDLFEMAGLEQQLQYQRASAGEGTNTYFGVNVDDRGDNKAYSRALFYERLAPELLVDVMGGQGEKDEHGIEDTIHEKVRGVIHARHRTELAKADLLKAELVLKELERLKDTATAVQVARQELDQHRQEISFELAALRNVLIDNPIPGVPRVPPPGIPDLAQRMVLQDGMWFLPDRVMAQFTGEPVIHVNQRAEDRNRFILQKTKRSQLIDIPCVSFSHDDVSKRGPAPKLYSRETAVCLLNLTTNFTRDWTQEKAIDVVTRAFDWVETHADTNPARKQYRDLQAQLAAIEDERSAMTDRYKKLVEANKTLLGRRDTLGSQIAELKRMTDSRLFTPEELAEPLKTGGMAIEEKEKADKARLDHLAKVNRLEKVFKQWRDFVETHGIDADPGFMADTLVASEVFARKAVTDATNLLDSARKERKLLEPLRDFHRAEWNAISVKIGKLDELKPSVTIYRDIFADEAPDGLAERVKEELQQANQKIHGIELERAKLSEKLEALNRFTNLYPQTNPSEWLTAREMQWAIFNQRVETLGAEIKEDEGRLSVLKREKLAPGEVARKVLDKAGGKPEYLYKAVEKLGLEPSRLEVVLSLFSALLFAPVYQSVEEAIDAAKKLYEEKIEAPVFAIEELGRYCRNGEIKFHNTVAHAWLVGIKTRQVDCVLDPSLVQRERDLLASQTAEKQKQLRDALTGREANKLDHEHVILSRKADEAISNDVLAKDKELSGLISGVKDTLPRLQQRAEALGAIKSMLDYHLLVGNDTVEAIRCAGERAREAQSIAEANLSEKDRQISEFETLKDEAQTKLNSAVENTINVSLFRSISDFMHHETDNPIFMGMAEQVLQDLSSKYGEANTRANFNFELASRGVGQAEVLVEIARDLQENDSDRREIEERKQPDLTQRTESIGRQQQDIIKNIARIDALIHNLLSRFRKLNEALPDPMPITEFELHQKHNPLFDFAIGLRDEGSLSQSTAMLIDYVDDSETDASEAKGKLERVRAEYGRANGALNTEIGKTLKNEEIGLQEFMKVELESARTNPSIIDRLYEITDSNYRKNKDTNEIAKSHLDKEWEVIGDWLSNFTKRLPGNLSTMKEIFAPVIDQTTGKVERAGFKITGKVADIADVRITMEQIVQMIEEYETSKTAKSVLNENMRNRMVDALRQEIRKKFYSQVLIDPTVSLCMPSISDKSLPITHKMVSSGQQVAVTLLWIVKMAKYVAERELRSSTVDAVASGKLKQLRNLKTLFVIIDGAFSHVSDANLINDALYGINQNRGRFQMIITCHDAKYKNDFTKFPTLILGRALGEGFMYADCETRRLHTPEEMVPYLGSMELLSARQLPAQVH